MIAQGKGIMAGGVGMKPLPTPRLITYSFEPHVKKRHTSPFRDANGKYLPIKASPPRPAPVKIPPKPRVKKAPVPKKPKVDPPKVARNKAAKEYLLVPKTCAACGNLFHSREGERIDGYRRRTTCDRKCAYNLRLTKEGAL